jgi:hypothetical protein
LRQPPDVAVGALHKRIEMMKHSKKAKPIRVRREPSELSRVHWWQEIQPRGAALLGIALQPFLFIVKNLGSHGVRLRTSRGDDVEISPGVVRAIYIEGDLRVENHGESRVVVEFDFVPVGKRHWGR